MFQVILSSPGQGEGTVGWTEQPGEANWGCVTLNGAVPGCTLLCEGPITASRGVGETPLVAVTLTLHQLNASGTVSIQEFRHLWKQLMFYQVRTSVHTASHGME